MLITDRVIIHHDQLKIQRILHPDEYRLAKSAIRAAKRKHPTNLVLCPSRDRFGFPKIVARFHPNFDQTSLDTFIKDAVKKVCTCIYTRRSVVFALILLFSICLILTRFVL